MSEFTVDPAHTALINVDMQRCFVGGSPLAAPDGPALAQRINRLSAVCREAGVTIVHTRCWMRPDGSNLGVMGEIVPPFIHALYTAGAETAEIHDAVVVERSDVILNKPRYGAFTGTELELILRSKFIDTVIISGIATNICCETTAREAAQRDFHVFFLSDGTATKEMNGVPADVLQRATCASLGMVFAQIATIDEMIGKIRSASTARREHPPVGQPA
ncbi:MAG: cysteine hydrolase [Chloroflexota bacterium]